MSKVVSHLSKQVIELADEIPHRGDKLDQSLRDQGYSKVVALSSTLSHYRGNILYDLTQGLLLLLNLLRDEADIGLRLESALESNVRGRASHHLDEVPILARRVAVALDVSDDLGVDLSGCIKAKGGLYLLVLQVPIDRLRTADHLYSGIDRLVVLGEYASIGIGVIATDDHESRDMELTQDLESAVELVLSLQFRATGADHVKSSRIAILIDDLTGELYILVLDQSGGSHQESVELALGIKRLNTIKDPRDHIVSTGGLTTGQEDTYIDRVVLGVGIFPLLKGDARHTVGVGEELLDSLLVSYRLRGVALDGV